MTGAYIYTLLRLVLRAIAQAKMPEGAGVALPRPTSTHGDQAISAKCPGTARFRVDFRFCVESNLCIRNRARLGLGRQADHKR